MSKPIYLDYAATTPIAPSVAEVMLLQLQAVGNASSLSHAYGRQAKDAVELAREQVATLINAEPQEIIFTSGATESINLALKGAAQLYQRQGKHIITLKTEHKAVLDTCFELEKIGYNVTYLSPESNGVLDIEKLKAALRDDTILVSILHVNNETGVIQDLASIAEITSARGILLHVDAAQSVGKIPCDVRAIPLDLMSLNAHKLYGPKGVGALYMRRKPRVRVAPQIHGGGQEQGMRSGTLAVHQIAGMGACYALAQGCMQDDALKVKALRDLFWEEIKTFPGVACNSDLENSYPGIINVSFADIASDTFMKDLPELAVAAGSACTSKGVEPSYVLRAMGYKESCAKTAIRFSWGRYTTPDEIQRALHHIRSYLQI